MNDDLAIPVPVLMPAIAQADAWLPPKIGTMPGEHLEPEVPAVHAEPEEVAIEEFLQAQQQKPAMPVREILNRTMLADALNELAHRVDDDMDKSCAKMQETALAITDAVQQQLDAAVALAKADVRGSVAEAAEAMGHQAGEIVMKLLAEEVGAFAAALNKHTETMEAAAHRMHKAATEAPSAPSRFVWLVVGAGGFWLVTKYIDLGRWAAIGEAVIKSIKGVAA